MDNVSPADARAQFPRSAGELERLAREKILILDGAMGTMIQQLGFSEAEFRGQPFESHPSARFGCNDLLSWTQPAAIQEIHHGFLDAGADILSTNTFNANRISLADYGLTASVRQINLAAVACARQAIAARRSDGRPRFVAGSIGPTNRTASLSPDVNDPGYRAVTFSDLVAAYAGQIDALLAGGVDLLLPETTFDTLNLKACLFAVEECFERLGRRVPVIASVTITDRSGRTLSGQTLAAFCASIGHADLFAVAINCALGPELMRPHVEELAAICSNPNGLLPERRPAQRVWPIRGDPGADGGRTRPVRRIRLAEPRGRLLRDHAGAHPGDRPGRFGAPAAQASHLPPEARYSGLEPLVLTPESNFTMIGERTNVSGSRKFARLIREENYAEAVSIARQQVEGGANIIDVNLDDGLIDGEAAMTRFLNLVAAEPDIARVPVMIDSSRWSVLEAGLRCVQGKPIANSISLKEGEEEFLRHARLLRRYGAACVVMLFDEEGQAVTVEHKVRIARHTTC